MLFKKFVVSVLLLAFMLGCVTPNGQVGGAIGTAIGAATGAAIGQATGRNTRGTLIGAGIGAVVGNVIGSLVGSYMNELDRRELVYVLQNSPDNVRSGWVSSNPRTDYISVMPIRTSPNRNCRDVSMNVRTADGRLITETKRICRDRNGDWVL